ncbi:hypothetical protein [Bosea beijingensis]
MEYHVDRRVILSTESEHTSLYPWSISEEVTEGRYGARKQVPWVWTLWFHATDITLFDTLDRRAGLLLEDPSDDSEPVSHRRSITAKLRPSRGRRAAWEACRYSFFGTDRNISSIDLRVEELPPDENKERCEVWGSPSYSAEGPDFRQETHEDYLGFHLYVRPETFARFATQISLSAVTGVAFGVGGVPGFYSDWSPTVVTNRVKILSSLRDQKVEIPAGSEIDPPRLGRAREFHLVLSSAHKLQGEDGEEEGQDDKSAAEPASQSSAASASTPSLVPLCFGVQV